MVMEARFYGLSSRQMDLQVADLRKFGSQHFRFRIEVLRDLLTLVSEALLIGLTLCHGYCCVDVLWEVVGGFEL